MCDRETEGEGGREREGERESLMKMEGDEKGNV